VERERSSSIGGERFAIDPDKIEPDKIEEEKKFDGVGRRRPLIIGFAR
jgi:hypothetical protein